MELDDAYANAAYIPNAEAYPVTWTESAKNFRSALGQRAELNVSYGKSERQAYDLFHPEGPSRGTLIFVHGGYWLRFDRSYWSHFAAGAIDKGWAVAMPSYDVCPNASIAEITNQIAAAICAIGARATGPLALSGHSAGGHLTARMLAPGVLPVDILQRITKAAPISPLSDLRPFLQTSMNADFKLDLSAAEMESPLFQPAPDTPVTIWVGANERPAFLEQAAALSTSWEVPQVVVPEKHHFDIIDALKDANSDVIRFLTA